MKNAFIWIQVLSKENINFTHPLVSWVKMEYPQTFIFDFDNHSEGFIIDRTLELQKTREKMILFIQAEEGSDTGPVTRFLNRLSRLENIQVLKMFNGQNHILEKMLSVIGDAGTLVNISAEDQKQAIIGFLAK